MFILALLLLATTALVVLAIAECLDVAMAVDMLPRLSETADGELSDSRRR